MFKRVSLQFILYFLGFYAALVILILSLLYSFLLKPITNFDLYESIKIVEIEGLEADIIEESPDTFVFSDKLTAFSMKNNGVLQLINEHGEVITTSETKPTLPDSYTFSELANFKNYTKWYSWLLENGMTLLFTEQTASDLLMEELITGSDFPRLTATEIELVASYDAIFDLYDEKGELLFSTNENKRLKPSEIIGTTLNTLNQEEIKSFHTLNDGTVAVTRIDNKYFETYDETILKILTIFLKVLAIFHGLLLLLVIIFSFLIGRTFGRPILYFLNKIDRLAKHDYEAIKDYKLRNQKTGRLKLKYQIYQDVDDSLTSLTAHLKQNEAQLKYTETLREDWITGLSHDLKTPLSAVLGYSMMLGSEHEWTREEMLEFASVITEKATYMDGLIDDLTYTYQLKNKGIHLKMATINLNEYVWDYINNKSTENIKLNDTKLPTNVLLDEKRFARVLENIVGNALKHNADDTNITLNIFTEKDNAILEIIDDGRGMDAATLENLFNRYYRGTNTTTDNIGTGLGLTIARQLVEAHDGSINVMSNASGTTVVITLPLA